MAPKGRMSKLYLTSEQSEVIRDVFREKGIETPLEISTALYKTKACSENYNNMVTVYSTIRKAFYGARAIPFPLIKGILELYGADERLIFLKLQPYARTPESGLLVRRARPDPWDKVLLSYFDNIRDKYSPLEPSAKIEVLGQLEEVVKKLS